MLYVATETLDCSKVGPVNSISNRVEVVVIWHFIYVACDIFSVNCNMKDSIFFEVVV
jgi:hypothetical protein